MTHTNITSSKTRIHLLEIWRYLSPKRRFQFAVALLLMLASGVAEMGALASVLPFLAVLSDPDQLFKVPWIRHMAGAFRISSSQDLLIPATLLFCFAAVLAGVVRLLNLWVSLRLSAAIGSDLSTEAYRRMLYQTYSVHLERNTSDTITAISTQTSNVVIVLNSTLQIVTGSVVSLGILLTLLAIDWQVASAAIAVFGTAYGVLSVTVRRRLLTNSWKVTDSSKLHLKMLQEGFGGIRDVILDAKQPTYAALFRKVDNLMRLRQAQSSFLGTFPRFTLEALGLVLISFLAILLYWQSGDSMLIVPLLGTLALGSQRLLPALQQTYSSWALVKSLNSSLVDVLEILKMPMPQSSLLLAQPQISILHSVQFKELSFKYNFEGPLILDRLNLQINRGERIGLIGSTGSGKSTLVDLLIGLLKPTHGKVLIDHKDLHDHLDPVRLSAWWASISYVPQNIFLSDSSIAENIAFGSDTDQIDLERVRQAAEQAQISSFIESSPMGYDGIVGERGVRLSGGQRQRIGIARALYKNSNIIILDEATSALDNSTEKAVIDFLESLSRKTTVVMVAHRLSTVARCDRVIRLNKGCIVADGPPEEVLDSSLIP